MSAKLPTPISLTGATLVKTGKAEFYGITVTVATATGSINVYDNTSAAGTIVAAIPASSAIGTNLQFPQGVRLNTGLYVDFAGGATGTVCVQYK